MKAIIQRVLNASVEVNGNVVGKITNGILIYLGIFQNDTQEQAVALVEKIARFRIFPDHNQRMNLSLLDVNGQALVVSQFTLVADGKKGNRPSFDLAEQPERAKFLVDFFIHTLRSYNIYTETGIFGEHMYIHSINDGPVNFILEK